jgi:flotillin
MYQSVPPLQEVFNMAGMQLPEYLKGKDVEGEEENKKDRE